MAVTLASSGTQTTSGTNATYGLVSATDQGVYIFWMSLKNMKGSATADWVEVEVLRQITTTSTAEIVDVYTMVGPQSRDAFRTQPYPMPQSCLFVVNFRHRQFCSTGTDFLWGVDRVT